MCREPGRRDPETPPRSGHRKSPEVASEPRLPSRGVRPGSPRPGPGHSPMSPSSSSSSSSSMFSRTFLVIICMSPPDRRSALLGSARLRSARAASSAQPSRRHSLLHSARALLHQPRSRRLSMLRKTPPLPPQIKPPRLRGAQEEVGGGGRLGLPCCACGTRCSCRRRPAPRRSSQGL